TLDLNNIRLQKNGGVGSKDPLDNDPNQRAWEQVRLGSGFVPTYVVRPRPKKARVVTITLPDGQVFNFTARFSPSQQAFYPLEGGNIDWVPQPGTKGRLQAVDGGYVTCSDVSGPIALLDDEGQVYDPQEFLLTLPDGRQFAVKEGQVREGGGIQWMRDVAGNRLTFERDGIASQAPDGRVVRSVQFVRDGRGYIRQIVDMRGNSSGYSADGWGNLVASQDRVGNLTSYAYSYAAYPHYLTQITDPRGPGFVPVRNYYDAEGRLDYSLDAKGNKVDFTHDVSGRTETTLDRLGHRMVMLYDDYGNVTETRRELRDRSGNFVRWVVGKGTYDLSGENPGLPTSITQYPEPGHAVTTTLQYDRDGNVTQVVDPLGHKAVMTYANSRLLTVQDQRALSNGYFTVRNQYDTKGNLLSSKDALDHQTTFTYYPSGVPQTVTDAQDHKTSFVLDSRGNISAVKDANNHVTNFFYDENGNKIRSTTTRTVSSSIETLTSQVVYDAEDRPVGAITPDGTYSATVYNPIGKVERSIRASGSSVERVTRYEYDELGQRVKTILPDGGVTTTQYDDAGRVSASLDRVGRGSFSEYDSLNRLVRSYQIKPGAGSIASRLVEDAQGSPLYSETKYDDLGRAIASRDVRGLWSYARYDDASNVLESEDALGHVTKSVYDELNRAYRTIDAKNHAITTTRDDAGRAIRTTFHDGTYAEITYDELNRPVATRDQSGHVRRMHYDTLGRMDWIEMPVDQEAGRYLRTRFGYNELGQKIWQQDAKGVATDVANGLNVNTDAPVSRATKFYYDKRGRLTARYLPGTFNGSPLIEAIEYNELGQRTRQKDFRGYWTSFSYDVRGRLTAKIPDMALNEVPVTYEYPDEFTVKARRGLALTVQHFDEERGWLNEVEAPHGTLSFSHNAFGQMTTFSVTAGGGTRTTSYVYDELNRVSRLTAHDGQQWRYDYDEVGNKAHLYRPNGVHTTYQYDSLNRLTDIYNSRGSGETGVLLSHFAYNLRADGRRDALSETLRQPDGRVLTRTVNYAFDDANRLTAEGGQDGAGRAYSKTYVLDEAGNRRQSVQTQATVQGTRSVTTTYSYNDLDWLTQTHDYDGVATTTTTYAYDANGAEIGTTTQMGAGEPSRMAQAWDFEGHLIARGAVNESGAWTGTHTTYDYDAAGLRLSQNAVEADGTLDTSARYLWNGDKLIEERDESGALQARYEHGQELGPLRLDCKNAQGISGYLTSYFIGDGQDSTRQLTNISGQVSDSYFYDAFGVDLDGGQGVNNNAFRYTGQQKDDNGLYYLRARYYNASSGRFLSHDPVMGSSDDPDSFHRYLYASAD
ncbi:MAG: hypothetical protein M3347_12180, partial [Armatimonadota bacterium]|nr:hypothetical protein [Armatimonadota bacterium]